MLPYVLAAIAALGIACATGAVLLLRYAAEARRRTLARFGLSGLEPLDQPVVSLRHRAEEVLDARLAQLPSYPGAAPYELGIVQQVGELHVLGATFRTATARFRTAAPPLDVWEFFRAELPRWQPNPESTGARRELVEPGAGEVRSVLVYVERGETIVELSTRPPGYSAAARTSVTK